MRTGGNVTKRSGIIHLNQDSYLEFVTIKGSFAVWLIQPDTRTYVGSMTDLSDVQQRVYDTGLLQRATA